MPPGSGEDWADLSVTASHAGQPPPQAKQAKQAKQSTPGRSPPVPSLRPRGVRVHGPAMSSSASMPSMGTTGVEAAAVAMPDGLSSGYVTSLNSLPGSQKVGVPAPAKPKGMPRVASQGSAHPHTSYAVEITGGVPPPTASEEEEGEAAAEAQEQANGDPVPLEEGAPPEVPVGLSGAASMGCAPGLDDDSSAQVGGGPGAPQVGASQVGGGPGAGQDLAPPTTHALAPAPAPAVASVVPLDSQVRLGRVRIMPSGARRGPGGGGGGSSRPSAPVLFTPNFTPHASAETAGGMLALPGGRGTLVNPGVAKVTLDEQQRLIAYQRAHKPRAKCVSCMFSGYTPGSSSPGRVGALKRSVGAQEEPNARAPRAVPAAASEGPAPPPSPAKPSSAAEELLPPADIPVPSRMAPAALMASRDAWNSCRPFSGGSGSAVDPNNDLMPSRPHSRESLHRPSSRDSNGASAAGGGPGAARGAARKPKPWDPL